MKLGKLITTLIFTSLIGITVTSPLWSEVNAAQVSNASPSSELKALVNQLLNNHYDGMVKQMYVDSGNITEDTDNTYLWKRYSESQTQYCKIAEDGMKDYSYEMTGFSVETPAEDLAHVTAKINLTYTMNSFTKFPTIQYGLTYKLIFTKVNHNWKVSRVESSEDFYQQFNSILTAVIKQEASLTYRQAIDHSYQLRIADVISIKELINEQEQKCKQRQQQKQSNIPSSSSTERPILTAGAYSYSFKDSVSYARRYANNNQADWFIYFSGNNCTNFVSQCIWAGYGGNNTQVKNNITNQIRMVPGEWTCNSSGGTAIFGKIGKHAGLKVKASIIYRRWQVIRPFRACASHPFYGWSFAPR